MKRLIVYALAVFVASCGNNESELLNKLITERDSLKGVYGEVGKRISELEEEISGLDTTVKERKVLVTTKTLKPEKFAHFFEVHGLVKANLNVVINAEIPGTIKKILVEEGQKVLAGHTLAVLNTDVIQNSIEEVKTALELANTFYIRQESLWKQNIGSEMQFLEAKNRKESLEQKLETLNAQLDKSVISAPFAGVVDEIFSNVGEMAAPQLPLLRLINLKKVYITADVSEEYLLKVRFGNIVNINYPSLDDVWMEGRVSHVSQYINPNNRTFKIRVDLDNPENMLKPNLLCIVKIKDVEIDSAITVPAKVIQQDARGENFLYIVEDSGTNLVARKIIVEPGITYKGKTQISKGLNGDEILVLEGARNIKDGDVLQTNP